MNKIDSLAEDLYEAYHFGLSRPTWFYLDAATRRRWHNVAEMAIQKVKEVDASK